jgi:hypothetical protein
MTINRGEFIEGAALVAGSVAVTGALAFAGQPQSSMVARW